MDNTNTEFMSIMLEDTVQDRRISDIIRIASHDFVDAPSDSEVKDAFAELAAPVLRYYGILEREHVDAVYKLFWQKRTEEMHDGQA